MGSKAELLARGAQSVADGEDARVEHADDVAGIGLLDDLPLGGHQLLGAGTALSCRSAGRGRPPCPRSKLAGAHAHEGDAVPVGLVHVGLDLKDKGGKIVAEGVDDLVSGSAGQGSGGHTQEVFQEGLHAEVGEGGAEEHRGELAVADGVHVELRSRRPPAAPPRRRSWSRFGPRR